MVGSVTITRREVKYARLRVRENCTVELVVPYRFTERQVSAILERKANWVESKQRFFREHQSTTRRLGCNEVPLFGTLYKFVRELDFRSRVVVDSAEKVIRTGIDLSQPEERIRWYRRFARPYLSTRLRHLQAAHGFHVGRLFVLGQRKRWGSCTAKRNISLNWRLITAPEHVIDYVILHELMHTVEMNHGARFWTKLKALCPHAEEAVRWLNDNRPA
jgi:predicted metal-dependent hydrolase